MCRCLLRLILVICLPLAAGAAFAQAAGEPQRVLVGFTAPLSGPLQASATDALNGARLALDRLNRQESRIAGVPVRFELLVKDDQASPERGVDIVREFAEAKVSAVLGPFNSGVALAVARLYNQNRLPMLTVASHPAVTRGDNDYVFRLAAHDGDMGRKLAQYAARTLKYRRVAIIQDGSGYGEGLIAEFQAGAKQDGLQTAIQLQLAENASDPEIRGALELLRKATPDALFFAGYVPQAAKLLKEMQAAGLALPMLAGDAECSSEMFRLAGNYLANGVYCVQGGLWLTRVADGAVFAAAYQSRYGRPPDVYAASFYDGLMLLARAMQTAGSSQPERFLPALARSRYKGATSTYEFDARHDLKESTVTILRLKDGGLVPLASF
jgi:ABC-type branched-subunit amino acid transport system substrate-binding protein